MTIETIRQAAVANPDRVAKVFRKNELYSVIENMAREIQRTGESIFKARVRAQSTPEGAAVMSAYAKAENTLPSPLAAEKRLAPDEFRKQAPGGSVIRQIDSIAEQIAREEKAPLTKATALAWERNADLQQSYDQKRRRVVAAC